MRDFASFCKLRFLVSIFPDSRVKIAGIVGSYNVRRSSEAFVDEGQRLFDDGFTASVTIILNGVNAFMYQAMLLPLYFQIALQKTVVCTANDVFALFDATGTKIRLGRPDLQNASDISSGVCVSAYLAAKLDALLEKTSKNDVAQSTKQLSRDSSVLAASIMTGSTAGIEEMGQKSARILQLLNGNKPFSVQGVATSLKNAASNAGQKMKPIMDRIQNNKLVSKIGSLMGKMQLGTQIHLIDSMITYAIGVVSGMADMAQVRTLSFIHASSPKKSSGPRRTCPQAPLYQTPPPCTPCAVSCCERAWL